MCRASDRVDATRNCSGGSREAVRLWRFCGGDVARTRRKKPKKGTRIILDGMRAHKQPPLEGRRSLLLLAFGHLRGHRFPSGPKHCRCLVLLLEALLLAAVAAAALLAAAVPFSGQPTAAAAMIGTAAAAHADAESYSTPPESSVPQQLSSSPLRRLAQQHDQPPPPPTPFRAPSADPAAFIAAVQPNDCGVMLTYRADVGGPGSGSQQGQPFKGYWSLLPGSPPGTGVRSLQ
ncbi:hypothetical protein PLESTF_000378000 [Pleodorina starrii]|nr:hypothetical protein PLESTF_000378000 [Pleodorina starrii]